MSYNPTVTYEVVASMDGLRRRYVASWVVRECATWLTVLSLAWITLAMCDYLWEWPLVVRRIGALLVGAVLLVHAGYRASHILSLSGRKRFAALLEGRFADFGQRLRTLLEVSEGGVKGPHEMLSALGHQTLGRWETVVPSQIIPLRQTLLGLAVAVLAISTLVGLLNIGEWRTAMLRSLGSDVAYTSLDVSPRNARVIEGEPITVAVTLQGRTRREVTLRYRLAAESGEPNNNAWTEIDLLPQEPTPETETNQIDLPPSTSSSATFVAELGKATGPIEYQFATSAGATAMYRIDVEPLIDAIEIRTVVRSPAYTLLEPREYQQADVSALQGSELEVTIITSHPLVRAQLLIGAKSTQLAPWELPQSGVSSQWSFKLPTIDSIHWRFEGEGQDDVPLNPVNGRLRIRTDQPPKISWRGPVDEIRVHTLTELPMEVDVTDDYGLIEAGIIFELGDEDEFVLTQWSAAEELESESRVNLRLMEVLPLESFGLTEQDFVAYHAYAIDNRAGTPSRAESDVRYVDIRPLRQFYAEGDASGVGGGLGGGFSTSVGEIIQQQRYLLNRTRKFVRSTTALEQQLGTIDGLVSSQSQLAGLARFLIDRLFALGRDDNEALAIAETAMLQAADSLAVGNFPLAFTQQAEAMRALVEARNSLREIALGQLSAQQRQALSRLLQELNQKLRRTTAPSDRALADSIQKLAAEQLALGDSVAELLLLRTLATSSQDSTTSPNRESTSSDQVPEPNGENDEDEATLEERLANSLDNQLSLLARLQDIGDSLSDQVLESELVTLRLTDALTTLGELVDQLQDDTLIDFQSNCREAADELAELAVLIEATSQSEPVDRLPAIAELTATLAVMEQGMASALANNSSTDSSSETESPSQQTTSAVEITQLGIRVRNRSQTVRELMRLSAISSNNSASEVGESLANFLEENQLLETLQASEEFSTILAEATADSLESENPARVDFARAARERAEDYSFAAIQLEAIYRQLVTPQLARLREIEENASVIERKLLEEEELSGETAAEIRELELLIRAAGLDEIADVLMNGDGTESEAGGGIASRVHLTVDLLRSRIQQLIALGTAADRDTPVPPQYRSLVDRYFQVLSGAIYEADSLENSQ